MKRRDVLKERFKTLFQATPLLVAAGLYFVSKASIKISFTGDKIEWYNFVLVVHLLLIAVFISISARGFLWPPNYKVPTAPRDRSNHWDTTVEHMKKYEIEGSVFEQLKKSYLSNLVEDAEFNDAKNIKQNKLKNIAAIILMCILCSYIVLILILWAK